jgi:tetratricopeptide (TPR) repeat protein
LASYSHIKLTRYWRRAFFLLIVWLPISGASCSGFFDPAPDEIISKRTYYEFRRLPEEPAELLQMARTLYHEDADPEDMSRVLLAACRLSDLEPESAEAHYLAGRACGWLQDYGELTVCYDADRGRTRTVDCVNLAEVAARMDPDNAQFQYSLALNIGLELEHASIANASLILQSFMATLKRVIKLDSTIDEGGALRILGALYLKAPPWPTGPGDLDKSLELLGRAVSEHPEHPLNHLFMAEAQLEDEEPEEALASVELANSLLDPDKYFWRADRWRKRLSKVERRVEAALGK